MCVARRNRPAALFSVPSFRAYADARPFCEMTYYFYASPRERARRDLPRVIFYFFTRVSPKSQSRRKSRGYLLHVDRRDEQSVVGHEWYGGHHASLQQGKWYQLKQRNARAPGSLVKKTATDIRTVYRLLCTRAAPPSPPPPS